MLIYSFSENLSFISFISIIGTYSFNLIIISFFTAPAIYILRKSKSEIVVCTLLLLLPIIFLSYGSFYKEKFLNKEIKKNPYVIRVIGSNVSLNRFFDNTQTELIIEELIKLSQPEKNKRIFFLNHCA